MKDREHTRKILLEKIAGLTNATNVFDPLIGTMQRVLFKNTAEIAAHTKINAFPPSITFGRPKLNRYFFSIAVPIVTTLLILHYYYQGTIKAPVFLGILVLIVVYLPMMVYFWLSDRFKDRLTLNSKGIIFENYHYTWDKIVTTHIKEKAVYKGNGTANVYYLVLGMEQGILIDINLSPFSFTRKFFTTKKEELLTLCFWIEYYKHSDQREKISEA